MRIYATGMNPADANALKRLPRVAIFQAFVEMMNVMKERDHKLTWKETKVGDDLPHDTDAVIVSVLLPRSLNCPYALGAMWAIKEALRKEIPLVLYLTDWQFFRARSEFRSIAKAGMPYFSKLIGGALQYKEDPQMIKRHGEDLLSVCRQYDDPNSQLWQRAQVLVPKYTNWGDMRIIKGYLPGANPVLPMDPSPLFVKYLTGGGNKEITVPHMSDRKQRWLLPSLLTDNTWLDKQKLQWPVERYGPKGSPVVANEREVQKLYVEGTGALCPPYPTEGSGWWRSRWIHSALAGSVLLAGSADQLEVGEEYIHTAREYESMTATKLMNVAFSQTARMSEILQLDMDVLTEQIYAPFRKAGV